MSSTGNARPDLPMKAKLASFFLTLIFNMCAGVAIFFLMLLAMNGFNESDAEYGLGIYIVLAVLVSLAMSAGAVAAVHLLVMKRKLRGGIAALIAVPLFSIVGAVLKIVSSIIGVLIADYIRVNY